MMKPECLQCDEKDDCDVYCGGCQEYYHDRCFDDHHPDLKSHPKYPISAADEQVYVNKPNDQSLEDIRGAIKYDKDNTFIEIDNLTHRLKLGQQTLKLLRPSIMMYDKSPPSNPASNTALETLSPLPTPGFISFLGKTGSGKSWIIRGLMKDYPMLPSPLPSPGKLTNNVRSMSSNINLYVDGRTALTTEPVLFMDTEGLDGTKDPHTLGEDPSDKLDARLEIARKIYPKLTYIFSDCIVFVSTDPPKASHSIIDLVEEFARSSSRGSRHQGFRPALFIVFNKVSDTIEDWSNEASTQAFLKLFGGRLKQEVEDYFHPIHVVYIPHSSSIKAVNQLEQLGALLREEHRKARVRREQFSLSFTLHELLQHLDRALRVFSAGGENPSYDWAEEIIFHSPPTTSWQDTIKAFWNCCLQRFRDKSPKTSFGSALRWFSDHFTFCMRLHLTRHPTPGLKLGKISADTEQLVLRIQQYILQFAPCEASKDGTTCGGTRERHNINQHESSERWIGKFVSFIEPVNLLEMIESPTNSGVVPTVTNPPTKSFMHDVRCIATCLGCLVCPPSVYLKCGHTFCEICVEEIVRQHHKTLYPQEIRLIKCPFCPDEMLFSPRLLPPRAGYRILSLDGGGVRGIVEIHSLNAIEKKCFGIPIVYLFDFIIGTSIGGGLALSLVSKESPSTVGKLENEFCDLMIRGIQPRSPLKSNFINALIILLNSTLHRTGPMEESFKQFYGSDRRVLAASDPPGPLVAVTTVSMDNMKTAQVIPNYLRGDPNISRLIGPNEEDCFHLWEAARATAAAYPIFAAYKWREKFFLDGGFKINCPARFGYKEAKSFWKDRRLDILLSLGTGLYNEKPTTSASANVGARKVAREVVSSITDSDQLWRDFMASDEVDKGRCCRLDPLLSEDFGLAEVERLQEISKDAQRSLKTARNELENISNQLVASLFYCMNSDKSDKSEPIYHVLCRLPADVKGKAALLDHLVQAVNKSNHGLFKISTSHSNVVTILCDIPKRLQQWRLTLSQDFFITKFQISLPHIREGITISVQMADIFRDDSTRLFPISGMPYHIK